MSPERIDLGALMAQSRRSLDPAKYPEEVFELYSVPAFSSGTPEVIAGKGIGSSKQLVQSGDVLLSKIVPHIRRAWVVRTRCKHRMIASNEWIVFRGDKHHPDYLRHLLVSDWLHPQLMQTVSGVGGSLLRARPSYVAKITIPLPPLPEQKRIAAILDKADELRRKRREAIAKLDALIQSIFLDMFGDPVTNPMGWEVHPLGQHLEFLTTGSRGWAKYYACSGPRFIRSLDVQMNCIADADAVFVQPPDSAETRRTCVRAGDVLLTVTGSRIGRVATVPESMGEAYVSQHVAILRLDQSLLPEYVAHFLSISSGGQRQIAGMQYGQTKPGLNLDQIRSFQMPCAPRALQERFVACMSAIKAEHAKQERARVASQHLQQSLQASFFSTQP